MASVKGTLQRLKPEATGAVRRVVLAKSAVLI
jgi:hypothetical protein